MSTFALELVRQLLAEVERLQEQLAGGAYSEAQIREAFDKHGHRDDWGVQVIYLDSLINALKGEYDDEESNEAR